MTVMVAEVWDALKCVGVSDDHARRAAEAVADARPGSREEMREGFEHARREREALRRDMEAGFATLRQELRDGDAAVLREVQSLRGELTPVKWMFGFILAFMVAIALRLFTI